MEEDDESSATTALRPSSTAIVEEQGMDESRGGLGNLPGIYDKGTVPRGLRTAPDV
jgi:hypothetical protein